MKIGLLKYQHLDLERDVWKTLSAIKIIQTSYAQIEVTKNFLTSVLLLDVDQPFVKREMLTNEKIRLVGQTITDHIEILSKNNLIKHDGIHITIPSEYDDLLSYLANQIYLNISLPLYSFEFYERLIPQKEFSKGAYTNYDNSFTSLSSGMYIPRGLFIKTWIDDSVYSGIMEITDDFDDIYEYLQNIQKDLQSIGINIMVLEPIPVKPIPLFPLFTEANDLKQSVEKQVKESKQPISDPKEFLQKWHMDYFDAYHEIAKQIPRLGLADPYWNKPKHYVVITNNKQDTIFTAQYVSETNDIVDVRILEKIPFVETLYDELNDLPVQENLLRTTVSWSQNKLLNMKPPFYAALKNISQTIKEFNKKARNHAYDTNDISDEEIICWIKESIAAKRYLINKLNIKDKHMQKWLLPISVTAEYSLDEPKPNWRRSGNLFCTYSSSDIDKIEIHKLEKEEYKEKKLSTVKERTDKELLWFSSDLLHLMMEIRGEMSHVSL